MSTLSSLPAPHPGGGVQPKPEPPGLAVTLRIAPPKQPPEKRRTALWATLLTVALLAAGTAYYLNTQSRKKVSGGGPPIVTVSTAVVGMGDLQSTVRVNGTVGAQNFASLLAPRIMGSRTGFNRGGDQGGGGPMGDFSLVLMKLQKPGM